MCFGVYFSFVFRCIFFICVSVYIFHMCLCVYFFYICFMCICFYMSMCICFYMSMCMFRYPLIRLSGTQRPSKPGFLQMNSSSPVVGWPGLLESFGLFTSVTLSR
jgi:hypothetical protein